MKNKKSFYMNNFYGIKTSKSTFQVIGRIATLEMFIFHTNLYFPGKTYLSTCLNRLHNFKEFKQEYLECCIELWGSALAPHNLWIFEFDVPEEREYCYIIGEVYNKENKIKQRGNLISKFNKIAPSWHDPIEMVTINGSLEHIK